MCHLTCQGVSTILRRVFPSDHLHCIAWQPKSYITQKSSKCAILIIIAVGSTWNVGIFIFKSLNYTGYKHKITWIQISPFLITHEHQSVWRVIVWFRGAETRLQLSGNKLYAANFDIALCRVRSQHTMSWLLCGFSELLLSQNTRTYNYKIIKINPVAGQHVQPPNKRRSNWLTYRNVACTYYQVINCFSRMFSEARRCCRACKSRTEWRI